MVLRAGADKNANLSGRGREINSDRFPFFLIAIGEGLPEETDLHSDLALSFFFALLAIGSGNV
jgi:hypothetical protein